MNTRNQSLDVLRGMAVLMVIVNHYEIAIPHGESTLLDIFACGVDLFFVLSGFLISGLLFAEFQSTGSINLKRFWIRRGFKIYPPFYALLLLTALVALLKAHRVPRELIYETLFLQNYLSRFWPHTWSLAVEEHFYFSLPLLLLGLALLGKRMTNPFRAIPLISFGVSGLCLYMRTLAFRHGGDWYHIAFPTHLRIDALFAGVTLGYFYYFDKESFVEAGKWWVLVIGLLFTSTFLFLPSVPRLTFAYVAFSFIVAWAVMTPLHGRIAGSFARIGRYSYSIYLWHGLAIIELQVLPSRWFRFPVYVASALLLGTAMSKLIEFPALKVRDKFFPGYQPTRGNSFADDSKTVPTNIRAAENPNVAESI
jgi:peptidoglycan/LPS O-acetylase OafA/YrhL